jgi:hypothetical protein
MYQIIYIANGARETIEGLASIAQAEQYAEILKAAGYLIKEIAQLVV